MRVLVVEDHQEVAQLVVRALEKDGHRVTCARSVADADEKLHGEDQDAIVLDLGLPDGNGIAWCARIRADGVRIPVLVLTASSAVPMRVAGLDAGADDFLAKPFAVAELRARVRALGRRSPMVRATEVSLGDVHLDFSTRRARAKGVEVPLTAREWNIIELLAGRPGRVVVRNEITQTLWGEASDAAAASLEVLVGRIRKKLGPGIIRTIRGEGYAAG